MKTLTFAILLLASSLTHGAILSFPIFNEYGTGYTERSFNEKSNVGAYFFEADLGAEKIYGFQLYMELAPSSIFYGSSSLGFSINRNHLFDGWLATGIILNELSPSVMRYSMYKELEIEEESYNKFAVAIAYYKSKYTRFLLKNVTVLVATDINDRFEPDTANAPYLSQSGEPLYYRQIPEPETYSLVGFLFLALLVMRLSKSQSA